MTITTTSWFSRIVAVLSVALLGCGFASAQGLVRVPGLQLIDAVGANVGDVSGQGPGQIRATFSYNGNLFRAPVQSFPTPQGLPSGYFWMREDLKFVQADCGGTPYAASWNDYNPGIVRAIIAGPDASLYLAMPDVAPLQIVIASVMRANAASSTSQCLNIQTTIINGIAMTRTDLNLATVYTEPFHLVAGGGRGDVNGNGTIEPSDIMYLINYMFANGPQP